MELVILVLYWSDDDGRNSYHYPGMAPVSSAGVGDTLLKRGHYQPRSSLCLGHNQSVCLGEGVASLSELKIANLLMTTRSGQGDLYKSVHPQCMNGYTPGVALYTASRHQLKKDLTENESQDLMENYATYYGVNWANPTQKKHRKIALFKTLLYPREMTSRHVLA